MGARSGYLYTQFFWNMLSIWYQKEQNSKIYTTNIKEDQTEGSINIILKQTSINEKQKVEGITTTN